MAERTSQQKKTVPKDFRPPKAKAGREEIQLIFSVVLEHPLLPSCLTGRDTPFLYFREGSVMLGNLKKQSRLGLKIHHPFSIGKEAEGGVKSAIYGSVWPWQPRRTVAGR